MKEEIKGAPGRGLDRAIKILGVLLLLVVIASGLYYYIDRYVYTNVPLVEREAKRLEEMIRRDPSNPDLRVQVALYYAEKGLLDEAIVQSKEALRLNEYHQEALIALGDLYMRKGRFQEALEPYGKVVEMNRENPFRKENKQLEGVYYYMGVAYLGLGRPADAIEQLKEALTIDRTDADAHYMLGSAYQHQGNCDEAVSAYNEALRFVPDFKEVFQGLAQCYDKTGAKERANYARAMVSYSSAQYDEAIRQLQGVVAAMPDFAEAYFGLGMAYEKKGRKELAIGAYENAVRAKPDFILAQQRLQGLRR